MPPAVAASIIKSCTWLRDPQSFARGVTAAVFAGLGIAKTKLSDGHTGDANRRAEAKRAEQLPNHPPPPPNFTKTEQPGAEEPANPQPDDDGGVWFITGAETAKTHEIEADTRVHIICQNDRSAYLSLSGRADLVRDRAKAAELWQAPFRVWVPGSKDDPNIELIVVRPEEGGFWDNEDFNKIKHLFESAKAQLSGKTPEVAEGEQHGRVRLQAETRVTTPARRDRFDDRSRSAGRYASRSCASVGGLVASTAVKVSRIL